MCIVQYQQEPAVHCQGVHQRRDGTFGSGLAEARGGGERGHQSRRVVVAFVQTDPPHAGPAWTGGLSP